jgi:rod shape-determining protein MreB
MREKKYYIDPGFHTLKLYHPRTRSVCALRSVYWKDDPSITGQDALEKAWKRSRGRLVYPLEKRVFDLESLPLVQSALKQVELGMLLQPGAGVLSEVKPDAEQMSQWQTMALRCRFSSMKPEPIRWFASEKLRFFVHAGASHVLFVLSMHKSVIACASLQIGGRDIDRKIMTRIARKHKSMILEEDACKLKEQASEAFKKGQNPLLSTRALDQRGNIQTLQIRAGDLFDIMQDVESDIALRAKKFLQRQPEGVMLQALMQPVVLSGGMALCYGMDTILSQALASECIIPEDPVNVLLHAQAGKVSADKI